MESKFEDCLCIDCLVALQKEYVVFQEKHPHSITIRRALNNKRLKAIGMVRFAVQLGMRTLGDVESQFEREMAIRAS